jgi:hypothetical protein
LMNAIYAMKCGGFSKDTFHYTLPPTLAIYQALRDRLCHFLFFQDVCD